MKTFNFIAFLILFSAAACEKIDNDAPGCIKDKIRKQKKELFPCENDASVNQYSFQGKFVYVFDPGTCGADMQAPVYDETCNLLGNLGGFIGNLTINGERFDQKAKFIKTIWTN